MTSSTITIATTNITNIYCRHRGVRQKPQRLPLVSPVLLITTSIISILFLFLESASSFIPITLPPVVSTNYYLSSASASASESASSSSSSSLYDTATGQHVVVVGGGIGGLAVAARIAASSSSSSSSETKPTKVTILEKNAQVGGRCGSFWVDPTVGKVDLDTTGNNDGDNNYKKSSLFRHEQGPSLLLLPSIYKDLFTETTSTNKTASDYGLDIVQCVPAYQVIFDDGDRISVGFPEQIQQQQQYQYQEVEKALSRTKMDTYEVDGSKKWDDYMTITSAYLNAGLPNFIEERLDLTTLPEFLIQSLKNFGRAWPLKPHSDVLDEIFDSNKLKALASFQDLYVGLEPYRNEKLIGGGVLKSTAPAVFGLLAAIELHPTNDKAGGTYVRYTFSPFILKCRNMSHIRIDEMFYPIDFFSTEFCDTNQLILTIFASFCLLIIILCSYISTSICTHGWIPSRNKRIGTFGDRFGCRYSMRYDRNGCNQGWSLATIFNY